MFRQTFFVTACALLAVLFCSTAVGGESEASAAGNLLAVKRVHVDLKKTDNVKPTTNNAKSTTDSLKPTTDNEKPTTDNKKQETDISRGRIVMEKKAVRGGDAASGTGPAGIAGNGAQTYTGTAEIEPAASLIPEIYSTSIVNIGNTTDPDSDGYYLEFDFDVAIDADILTGYNTWVSAIIICETTGQEWPTVDWRIYGEERTAVWVPFDETDFAGHLDGNTNLDFTVELYNPSQGVLLDTATSVTNEPFKADTDVPSLAGAKIYNLANLVDVDADSYYEEFDFDIGINARVPTGKVNVKAKVLCPTTAQSWETKESWTASSGQDNWANVPFDETDFAGKIGFNASLDFTVELYNTSFTTKHGTITAITGEPFRADIPQPPPYLSGVKIYNITNLQDPDGDGYFSKFRFEIGILATVDMGSVTMKAKILCPATGQVRIVGPWTISPSVPYWKNVAFDHLYFADSPIPFGHVALDFTVELYDSTLTTLYDSETSIVGEPFLIEPYKAASEDDWVLY